MPKATVEVQNAEYKPFMQGKNIFLREVRQSDVTEQYYKWLNDPEINQFLETRYVARSLENISAFVRSMDAKSDEPFFAICLNGTEEHIGNIKLGPINWVHRRGMISLLIGDKDQWGKGYATEAIGLVTAFAFDTLNLNKVEAGCYANNRGSERAFEKCGFTREGLLRSHVIVNRREVDVVLLGITAAEYSEFASK